LFGRGPRAARGDVRSAILALLNEQPMHGYQIIRELSERSGGLWRPSPGSVYPTLQHLEDEGLVDRHEADGKNVFALTEAGRAVLATRPAGPSPWQEVSADVDTGLVELQEVASAVRGAIRQVAQNGTDSQLAAAKALLNETRRGLYRILADDPAPTSGESSDNDR